jgi:hypothetical protein
MGKNSSQRKTNRLIRELKASLGHKANFGRYSIQHEAVPIILTEFLALMKRGEKEDFEEIMDYMDEYKISKDQYAEHLMGLCMDRKIKDGFDKLDSKTKSAFTRLFN